MATVINITRLLVLGNTITKYGQLAQFKLRIQLQSFPTKHASLVECHNEHKDSGCSWNTLNVMATSTLFNRRQDK